MNTFYFILLLIIPAFALTPESTVILFNTKVSDSESIALYYQKKRKIPSKNVIGLPMPTSKSISVDDYNRFILSPLREELSDRALLDLPNQTIKFKALTTIYGVPLKTKVSIKKDLPKRERALLRVKTRAASIDSELTTLALIDSPLISSIPNPLYERKNNKAVTKNKDAIVLVGRIDAPTPTTCFRIIDDSIKVESEGLSGFCYIDKACKKNGLQMGDNWLDNITQQNFRQGIPTIVDSSPSLYPKGYPLTQSSLYYGWYAPHCSGALKSPQFNRGAIAVHIHSYSCLSLHNKNNYWAGPLLARGACATLGNVNEPFLHLTTHLDRFNSYLLEGLSLAESAWRATPNLSWHNIVLGDPLYRPFKHSPKSGDFGYLSKIAPLDRKSSFEKLTVKATSENSSLFYEVAGLALRHLKNHEKCLSYFRLAQRYALTPEAKVRNILHQTSYYTEHNQQDKATTLITAHYLTYRNTPLGEALQSATPLIKQ